MVWHQLLIVGAEATSSAHAKLHTSIAVGVFGTRRSTLLTTMWATSASVAMPPSIGRSWRRCLHHGALAGAASISAAGTPPSRAQLGRNQIEHLAAVVADHMQCAATAGALLVLDIDDDLVARQVCWQGDTRRLMPLIFLPASYPDGSMQAPLVSCHCRPRSSRRAYRWMGARRPPGSVSPRKSKAPRPPVP